MENYDESKLIITNEDDFELKYTIKSICYVYYKEIKSLYLFLIVVIIITSFFIHRLFPIKVCMCVIAKDENRYIREFIEHYKKYKIDKIFLYDNNDIDGERYEKILSDYINEGLVNIIDYRGRDTVQIKSYLECHNNNYKNYDWLIFYDVDEFLYLKDFNDVRTYLKDRRFKHCQRVQLNWIMYTDNNLLYYDNRSLSERFTEMEPNARNKTSGPPQEFKSMVRGHYLIRKMMCPHIINRELISCDGFGVRQKVRTIKTVRSDYEYYYIKHYYSKSLEEFMKKVMRKDGVFTLNTKVKMDKIKKYFTYNKITEEKIDFIEEKTGLNLSEYREKIKNISY